MAASKANLRVPSIPIWQKIVIVQSAKGIRPPWFITVMAALVSTAMIVPLLYLVYRGLSAGSKVWDILIRPKTLEITLNSFTLAFFVALLCIALGLSLAWLTVRTDLPGRKFWTVIFSLPLVIPSYLAAFTFVSTLGPRGIVQSWLEPLGVERLPSIYGAFGAILAISLVSYPFVFLTVRAGFKGVDPALEEAARSLGRSRRWVFWTITVPQLKPAITAGSLLAVLYALSDFGAVSMLQFSTFTQAIYVQYRGAFDRSVAAILALMLILLTLVILGIEAKSRGRAKYYRSSAGATRMAQVTVLGKWRWLALAYCTLISLVALVIPVAVIMFWLLRGFSVGESFLFEWTFIWNSILASGLAALAGVLAAIPVAVLAVRYPSNWTRLMEKAAYTGYALPGLVVALSLVFFGANWAFFMYQTLALLVFAYVVRFLPQVLGTTRTSMLQINPHVEEAARSLGRGPSNVLRTITLPLLKPGLLSGAALVFLTTMKELPATLILSPTGFKTLATRIWDASSEAFFAQAAAPALILILVSACSIFVILSQEDVT